MSQIGPSTRRSTDIYNLIHPVETQEMLQEVFLERAHQDAKWGNQNHAMPIWASIEGEEFGEACMEANKAHWSRNREDRLLHLEKCRQECIEGAAVFVAWAESIDRNLEALVEGTVTE